MENMVHSLRTGQDRNFILRFVVIDADGALGVFFIAFNVAIIFYYFVKEFVPYYVFRML